MISEKASVVEKKMLRAAAAATAQESSKYCTGLSPKKIVSSIKAVGRLNIRNKNS